MQTKFFKLDILSPVHIGTGEELDPMGYIIRSEADEVNCHVLNTMAWVSDYPDPDELNDVFSSGNIPAIRGFLANKADPDIYGLRRITVSNDRIVKEYDQKLADRQASHQLLFSPCMSTSDQIPFIPGSSIKGALRTAVIDWLDQNKQLGLKDARIKDRKGNAYRKKMESVLGPISDNAFKQIKISDVKGYADNTLLVEPLELRRKEGKGETPKNKCEVMASRLLGKNQYSTLYARIAIGLPNDPGDDCLSLKDHKNWSWSELAQLVNSYYLKRFDDEKAKFYGLANFAKAKPIIERLEAELNCSDGQMILRVGHYSQVEFVTVEDNAPLTRRLRDGTPMPYGTTRTLANGLFPFGWIRLTPCDEAEYLEGISHCETANTRSLERKDSLREKMLLERKKQIEEAQRREELAKQQAEEEAQRQAELESLPEDERNLLLLKQGELNENQVVEFFNKLDGMERGLQTKTAEALMEYWEKAGKWNKKDCSKKQLLKVKKIKSLLGQG